MVTFFVLNWNFNKDESYQYDIMPYLYGSYNSLPKKKKPQNIDELKEFIALSSLTQWRARCEYELVIHGFPYIKNKEKIDIYKQVMMNIELITTLMWNDIQ